MELSILLHEKRCSGAIVRFSDNSSYFGQQTNALNNKYFRDFAASLDKSLKLYVYEPRHEISNNLVCTTGKDSDIQLLSKFSLDSDFCHNYLHTLCTLDLILQCIKRCKLLFVLCFIKAHV